MVLNYCTPEDTLRAVRSLQASRRPVQDLIVVDNGSADGSEALLREALPRTRVLQTGANLGFSGGCNVGIRDALDRGAELVLLVNSDATLPPASLARLEEVLISEPSAGIAGPVILTGREPGLVMSAGISFSRLTGRMRHYGFGARLESLSTSPSPTVDGVSGCVMLIKREVFERIGLLAEEYFFSFEDLDFCLRAREAGFLTVCVSAATACHQGSRSIGQRSFRRIYFATRNHLQMAKRAAPAGHPVLSLLRSGSIVALNVAHALVSADAPVLGGLRGVVLGTWHHVRKRYGDGP